MTEAADSHTDVSLEVIGGPMDGLRYVGDQSEIHMGRSPGGRGKPVNDIVLSRDSYSSSSHAKVYWEEGRWYVQDLGSMNQSKVKGKTLTGETPPAPLEADDYFVAGNSVIEFSTEPRRGGGVKPQPSVVATGAAKKMLDRARKIGSDAKSSYVSVEHLFEAIAESEAPVVPDFFASAKLDPADVARQVKEYERWTGKLDWIGRGAIYGEAPADIDAKDLWETPRLQTVLALADKARLQTEVPGIEAVHLLTAILAEGGSATTQLLREMGQDCEALARIAARLTTAHFAPEEAEEPKKTAEPAKPKKPAKKPVDHGTWVQARELMDELLAAQVQYHMAEPSERLEALRGRIRDALTKLPPPKREALVEQLRLMAPVAEGKFELPEMAAAPAPTMDDTPQRTSDGEAAVNREATPVRSTGNEGSMLKEIFELENMGKTLGVSDDQEDSKFLQLTKLFYEFTLNIEQLTQSVVQTFSGGAGGESRYFLPFAIQDLKTMMQKALKGDDSEVVDDVRRYLDDLRNWQISLVTAFEKAGSHWNQDVWDRISPASIRQESKVTIGLLKMGKGTADLWNTFEKKVRDLDPEVAGDQFHQLVYSLTTEEFKKLSSGRRKRQKSSA